MIKLKNIVIDGDVVKCDISPEDSKEFGFLEVNIKTKDIINSSLPSGYEWCKSHINHAKDYLCNIHQNENILEEKLIMWC